VASFWSKIFTLVVLVVPGPPQTVTTPWSVFRFWAVGLRLTVSTKPEVLSTLSATPAAVPSTLKTSVPAPLWRTTECTVCVS
jgi:hypothetical protein